MGNRKELKINPETLRVEIDTTDTNVIYIVSGGKVIKEPAPYYGQVTVRSLGGKIDRISVVEDYKI